MKLSIFIKMLLVPVVFFSSLAFVDAQNIGSLKDVVPAGFSFKKDLLPGDTDPDITQLQKVLNADPDTTVSVSGDGSVGKESTYFGEKTKQAVIKFQQKYYESILIPAGLTVGNGNVGKSTRTRLNLLIGEMNTTDSSGRVQSRKTATIASPAVVSNSPAVQPSASVQTSSSLCSFINLLISIDAISQNNASRALGIFGCSSNYSYNSSTGGTPSVDLRVNGSNGPLTFSSERNVTISWTSENVTSCQSSQGSRPISGSLSYRVEDSGTFTISCTGPYGTVSDYVNVRLKGDSADDLEAYCYPSLTTIGLNQSVIWFASASGGPDGDYRYSWSGTDGLSGSGYSQSKSYSTSGTKSATVTVRSDDESETVSCGNISVTSTTGNLFNYSTTTSSLWSTISSGSSAAEQASVLINGQTQANVTQGASYQITYKTAGLNCLATSTPASTVWSGNLAERNGSITESNLVANSSGVSIYGPDGAFIESGRVFGDTFWSARFSKKGGDYPDGSYVSLKGQAQCVIAETSAWVKTCIPLSGIKKEYSMNCTLPTTTSSSTTGTSTVSAFYTSTTTNPQLPSLTWPVVKKAVANIQNAVSYYPFTKFLWKPVSYSNGKLIVMFGPFPDKEEEALPVQTDFGGTIVGAGNCKPDDGNHYRDFSVEQSDGSKVTVGWWPGQGLPEPVVGQTVIGYALSKGKPKCQDYDPLEGEISGKYIGMAYEMDVSGSGSSSGGKWQCRAGGCYWDPGVEGDNIGPNSQGDAKAYDLDYASKNPNGPGARGQQSGSQNLGSSDFEGGDVFDLKGGAEGAAIGTLILPGIGTVIGGTIGGFGDSISSVFKGF